MKAKKYRATFPRHGAYAFPAAFQAASLIRNFPNNRSVLTKIQSEAVAEFQTFEGSQWDQPVQKPRANQTAPPKYAPVFDKTAMELTFVIIFIKLYYFGVSTDWLQVRFWYIGEHNAPSTRLGRTIHEERIYGRSTCHLYQHPERTARDEVGTLWHELLHAILHRFSCHGCKSDFEQLLVWDGHGLAYQRVAAAGEHDQYLAEKGIEVRIIRHLLMAYALSKSWQVGRQDLVQLVNDTNLRWQLSPAQIEYWITQAMKFSPPPPPPAGGAGRAGSLSYVTNSSSVSLLPSRRRSTSDRNQPKLPSTPKQLFNAPIAQRTSINPLTVGGTSSRSSSSVSSTSGSRSPGRQPSPDPRAIVSQGPVIVGSALPSTTRRTSSRSPHRTVLEWLQGL